MADCSSLEYGDKRPLWGETESQQTWLIGEYQHIAAAQLKIMRRTPGKLIFIKEADSF